MTSKISRNDLCPCGSGRKYKHCCAKAAQDMQDKPLLQSISIRNFRCFEQLKVDSLARVNLIAGKNSVGKTALLEAIFLLIGAENLELILKISQFRGINELKGELVSVLELLWAPLFKDLDTRRKVSISSILRSGKEQRVELSVTPATSQTVRLNNGEQQDSLLRTGLSQNAVLTQTFVDASGKKNTFQMRPVRGELLIEPTPSPPQNMGYFLSSRSPVGQEESANLLGRLVRSKRVDDLDLVRILRETVEPRLRQLEVIPGAGASLIYGDIGLDQMIPLSLMGDGMSRVAGILLRIASASGGVVLIDEVENGLHHSIIEDVWSVIDKAARLFNTQVIATTHSYECISQAHRAFSKSDDYDFRLHRLDRVGENIEAIAYDQESLEAALESDFEVR